MRRDGGFWNGSGITAYLEAEAGNDAIRQLLAGSEPFMVARYGSYELKAVASVRKAGRFVRETVIGNLHINAGFFPRDPKLLERFADVYANATSLVDVLAIWNFRHGLWNEEQDVFQSYCPTARLVDLHALESFKHRVPWSMALEGRRVVVVHPFAASIRDQYARRRALFENPFVLPEFASLQVIPAVQSIAGAPVPYRDWFHALGYLRGELDRREFDVAIIGAGAYGLPLAAHVKERGRQAIHMGGATQVLFGIRGRRWDAAYPHLVRDSWVRPSTDERPAGAERVEGACYW